MTRRILIPLAVLAAALVTSCSPGRAPTTGAIAPDFELFDINGQAVSLSDYAGRPVALNFWGTN